MKFYTFFASALLLTGLTACLGDKPEVGVKQPAAAPEKAPAADIAKLRGLSTPDRMRIIWQVMNTQGKEKTYALLKALAADTARPEKERIQDLNALADFGRRANDAEAVGYAIAELCKLTPGQEDQAKIMFRNAAVLHVAGEKSGVIHKELKEQDFKIPGIQEPRFSPVQLECLAILNDPAYSIPVRAQALCTFAAIHNSPRKSNRKTIPAVADAMFFTIKDLPDDVKCNTLCALSIFCNIYRETKNDSYRYAKQLMNEPAATNQQKISMLEKVIPVECAKGEYAESEKLVGELLRADPKNTLVLQAAANLRMWQEDCDGAVKILRANLTPANAKKVYPMLAGVYRYFERFEDVAKVLEEFGDTAAAILECAKMDPAKARDLAARELDKPDTVKLSLLRLFMRGSDARSRAYKAKYADRIVKDKGLSGYAYEAFQTLVSDGGYDEAVSLYHLLDRSGFYHDNAEFYEYAVQLAAGSRSGALTDALVKTFSSEAVQPGKTFREKLKGAVREKFLFYASALKLADRKGEFAHFCKEHPFVQKLTVQERSKLILKAGTLLLAAGKDITAQEAYDAHCALLKESPQKTYTVTYSDRPILGMADMLALKDQPERQLMDRVYSGGTDIFITDVSTGDRGSALGSGKGEKASRPTELQIVADVSGIHFLFTIYDEKAREVEAGTVNGGEFELYFAGGENQPHCCMLPNMNTGRNEFIYNVAYETPQYRRINMAGSAGDLRSQITYEDHCYRFYMMIGWDPYFAVLPDRPGDTWDFENIHWSRFGGLSWSGVKNIHGRSGFGKLAFRFSKEQMRAIKKKIIYAALRGYQEEKQINTKIHGVILRWKIDDRLGDPVFYDAKVKPVVDRLDSYIPLVKFDMSGETIDKVFADAVPGWRNIRYTISRLREEYLEEQLMK